MLGGNFARKGFPTARLAARGLRDNRAHCTPEQSWRMANEANAERFFPMHHQTFPLGREPFLEPIERLHNAAGNDSQRIVLQKVGEEVRVG